jgi:hypothetical protein
MLSVARLVDREREGDLCARFRSPRRRRLAIVPLFAGLSVLVDDRRGLHDRIAGTVVLYSEEETAAERLPARTTVRSDPPTRAVFHEP